MYSDVPGGVLSRQGSSLVPLPLAMEDELRMHGDEERVPVSSLGSAIPALAILTMPTIAFSLTE